MSSRFPPLYKAKLFLIRAHHCCNFLACWVFGSFIMISSSLSSIFSFSLVSLLVTTSPQHCAYFAGPICSSLLILHKLSWKTKIFKRTILTPGHNIFFQCSVAVEFSWSRSVMFRVYDADWIGIQLSKIIWRIQFSGYMPNHYFSLLESDGYFLQTMLKSRDCVKK